MMAIIEFATATRVIFGTGAIRDIGKIAAEHGKHALIVTGRNAARFARVFDILSSQGIALESFTVDGEPTVDLAREGLARAQSTGCDMVIGLGGGSAIDAGKAIAALMTNPGDPLDYLEVIGRGKAIANASAPYIAIPTTAGTGSEVTRNAVLASAEHRVKVSLRSPLMLPRVALVDPGLTADLPPALTASTGLDALTQLIEPFTCIRPSPITDALCRDGIRRAARSLERAYIQGDDMTAREDMALASLFGGMALANARLGAVHGFAAPIGGRFPAPHGAVCACLLPHVMNANIDALRAQGESGAATLARYDEVAQIVTGDTTARADDGVRWVQALCRALSVPALSSFGITSVEFPDLIERAAKASSMQGNPVKLSAEALHNILSRAL